MANSENDDVVNFKVQRATAQNALQKISTIVAEEQRIEISKKRYTHWFLRAFVVLVVLFLVWRTHFFGVI